jgi:hypothetical protein
MIPIEQRGSARSRGSNPKRNGRRQLVRAAADSRDPARSARRSIRPDLDAVGLSNATTALVVEDARTTAAGNAVHIVRNR